MSTSSDGQCPSETSDGYESSPFIPSNFLNKRDADSIPATIWDNTYYFHLLYFILLVVIPFAGMLLITAWEGSLHLSGEKQGFIDEPNMLTVFIVVFLVVVALRHAVENQYGVFHMLNERTLRFNDDIMAESTNNNFSYHSSKLERKEMKELLKFYDFLLAKITFRASNASCPAAYEPKYNKLRKLRVGAIAIGIIVLGVVTYYHWFAESMYGVDLWSSSNYPLSFTARFIYELVALVLVGPWAFWSFFLLCFLIYHPFRVLENRNGIRFNRISVDDIGGFSAFGTQAFKNMLILAPFSVQIAIYELYLPTTEILLAGVVVYILAIPTFFFAQLLSAHRAMETARQIELEMIGEVYTNIYNEYKRLLLNNDTADINNSDLKSYQDSVEKWDKTYKQFRNSPTWPYQRSIIRKVISFVATLISGFGAIYIQVFI